MFLDIINTIKSAVRSIHRRVKIYIGAVKTVFVRTNKRKWKDVAEAGRPSWDARNEIIARYVAPNSTVLDIGCGAQTLRQYLPLGCRYQPCDLIKSSPDVIVCDFNAGQYPEFTEYFDFVVCSGVIEYIRNPETFIKRISRLGRHVLISYNPLYPGDSKISRMGNGWGWVNHFTEDELQFLFENTGLQWSIVHKSDLRYSIYLVSLETTIRSGPTSR